MAGKIKTAFFSGTFNPIHMGHLILANYMCEYEGFDEMWLSVSPQNPLRERLSTENDNHRLEMLKRAVMGNAKIKATDVEFLLPLPSYTIQTLDYLRATYPEREFTLIIGADNWLRFEQWREHERIINEYSVCIYPRPGYEIDPATLPSRVKLVPAPVIEISSTMIRQGVAEGKNMNYFVPTQVYDYIESHNLYKE